MRLVEQTCKLDAHNMSQQAHKCTHPGALNVFHIPLDGHHSLLVRSIDAVPDTQVASALGHHHITSRNPLHVAAVWQQGCTLLLSDVEEVQMALLVSKQQVSCPGIQLLQTAKLSQHQAVTTQQQCSHGPLPGQLSFDDEALAFSSPSRVCQQVLLCCCSSIDWNSWGLCA